MESNNLYDAESERLYIQVLTEEHLCDYHSIQSNVEATKWSAWPPHATLQETIDRIQESQPSSEKPWNKRFAILLKDNEATKLKMIGIVGMVREAELGYKLHPNYWGKGYMSEAMKIFLDMLWKAEEYQRFDKIIAHADPENNGSRRVLEKAGFEKGVLKRNRYSRAYLDRKRKSDLQEFYLMRPSMSEKE